MSRLFSLHRHPSRVALLIASLALGACASNSGKQEEKIADNEREVEEGDLTLGAPGDIFSGAGGASSPEGDAFSSCIRLASFGKVSAQSAGSGLAANDAVVNWLNQSSNVRAEYFAQQPVWDAEFLGNFDVVLLQDLSDWALSEEEISALSKWVRAGGGVMALSGYYGDGSDAVTSNQLLSFSGLQFESLSYQNTAQSVASCGYCLGSTYRQEGFVDGHPIAQGVTTVGAYLGRSVSGKGEIVAADGELNLAMTTEVGAGRVFLFHDDWITNAAQWSGEPSSTCDDNPDCAGVSPQSTYQVPQLWFNALNWLSPRVSCLEIDESQIIR